MTPRARTFVVLLLAAAIAVRVSVAQPLTGAAARVAQDPTGAMRDAFTGWTLLGTLGGATAQGVRDLPLAGLFWLGGQVGASAEVVQICWRVAVVWLAVIGAVRLARTTGGASTSGRRVLEPWTAWVGATIFGAGVAVVPALIRSPLDGLSAATLPWVLAPLVAPRRVGWMAAVSSAAWIGVAGFGSVAWAGAALGAGVLGAVARARRDGPGVLVRWLVPATLASVGWGAVAAWEGAHVRDVSGLLPDRSVHATLNDLLGGELPLPFALVVLFVVGPAAVAGLAVWVRPADCDPFLVSALAGGGVFVAAAWATDLVAFPVFAPAAGDPPTSVVGPALGWIALAALVAWVPLVTDLAPRVVTSWQARSLPSSLRDLVVLMCAVGVLLLAVGGLAAAAVQRPDVTDASTLYDDVTHWSDTADAGRVLVLPAGADSTTQIGQALGHRPWISRTDLPTSGAGGTTAIDDVVSRLDLGDPGPGTASALHRLGISYVAVELGSPAAQDNLHPTALVRASLSGLGATRVAVLTGQGSTDPDRAPALVDGGVRTLDRQVEIWSLPDSSDAQVYPGPPVEVTGDAGSVSDLANADALDGRAVHLSADRDVRPLVLSDSPRRRDIDQRVAVDPYGPDLEAEEPRQVVPSDAAPVTTAVRQLGGIESVSASSSAADVPTQGRRDGADPFAAIDGNLYTSWRSAPGVGVGEWWQVDLAEATSVAGGTVQLVRDPFGGPEVTRVRVTTQNESVEADVDADGRVALTLSEPSTSLRLTVLEVSGAVSPTDTVGIAEVTIPGLVVTDRLALEGPAASAWLFAARPGSASQCVPAVTGAQPADVSLPPTVCTPGLFVAGPDAGPIERRVENTEPGLLGGRVWARAVSSKQSEFVADSLANPSIAATSSSVATSDLANRPQAAADADPTTAWRPALDDAYPVLTLQWRKPSVVSGVRLSVPAGDVSSVPTTVRVTTEVAGRGGGKVTTDDLEVGDDGFVPLPAARADRMEITFLTDTGLASVDTFAGGLHHVPIAISEVTVEGGPPVRYDGDRVHTLDCGSGPSTVIGGQTVYTKATMSARELVEGQPVVSELCDQVRIRRGTVDISVDASLYWQPTGALLWRDGTASSLMPSSDQLDVVGTGLGLLPQLGVGRTTTVDLGGATAVRTFRISVPVGSGWEARSSSGAMESVTVDGWSEGWLVEDGDTSATLTYPPGESLRFWLLVGAGCWGAVLLLGLVGSVRALFSSRKRG